MAKKAQGSADKASITATKHATLKFVTEHTIAASAAPPSGATIAAGALVTCKWTFAVNNGTAMFGGDDSPDGNGHFYTIHNVGPNTVNVNYTTNGDPTYNYPLAPGATTEFYSPHIPVVQQAVAGQPATGTVMTTFVVN